MYYLHLTFLSLGGFFTPEKYFPERPSNWSRRSWRWFTVTLTGQAAISPYLCSSPIVSCLCTRCRLCTMAMFDHPAMPEDDNEHLEEPVSLLLFFGPVSTCPAPQYQPGTYLEYQHHTHTHRASVQD